MAFSFTPQQQQQQSLFQPQQSPFQQSSPFQQQTPQQQYQQQQFQQQQFQQQQFQQQQQQQQHQQNQQQQQLYLFTNEKTPANYSTKWADLHPDSQKFLLQIEERILEYRDESQRLDHCSRLYESSVSNDNFDLDASHIIQELGGIGASMERQKSVLHELMVVVKDMLRNTEVAIRSYMLLRPRFLHQNLGSGSAATAPSQASGATVAPNAGRQPTASSLMPVFDFYSGLPKKPSLFLQQTISRFDKYVGECRQWIEELEQLLLSDSERNSFNSSSSLLQSLPKVMSNVHDVFVHVAAKVESIHQYIESMKTAYLADQRRRGDGNDPFLEADRRETAKLEAAARRTHPTLHLPAISQPTTQVAGLLTSSAPTGASSGPQTTVTNFPASTGNQLFATPAATSSSLFSTPSTSAPVSSLFGSSASPQASLFGATSTPSLFGNTGASSTPGLFGNTGASSTPGLFGNTGASSTPNLFGNTAPAFGVTPSSGVSAFSTPFASGAAATGSGASFGAASKPRAKARTSGRR